MARGRFISNTLGESDKFAELQTDSQRLMYVLMLTHTDVEGRLKGNAIWLHGKVFTYLGYTKSEIEHALRCMHDTGLITWYTVAGRQYVQVEKFHAHNKVRRDRESASDIPPPPENAEPPSGTSAGGRPEDAGSSPSEVEVQVQVQDQVEEELTSPRGDTRSHLERLVEAWNENRGGLPAAQKLTTKRASKLRTLIRDLGGFEKAHSAITIGAAEVSKDPWWQKHQYGFDNLLNGQKVIQKAEAAWNRGTFDRQQAEVDRMVAALGPN